ncbi:bifunctional diguanylate cyclase/phosphodiesterase [Achromobacter denitrificans]
MKKFEINISLKLAGFLLALCLPPFLLYQTLAFNIVRGTIVDMARQQSINLLASQEAYLQLQFERIEDLLRNISAIDEIKLVLSQADGQAAADVPSFRFRSMEQLSTQSRISTLLNGYGSLSGLISIELFTYDGHHYHVGDTLDGSQVDLAELKALMGESRQAGNAIRWHGIRDNVNTVSDQRKVIPISQTLWQTGPGGEPEKPLAMLLVNYDPAALYQRLEGSQPKQGAQLMVIDADGKLLYDTNASLIGRPLSPEIASLLTGEHGTQAFWLADRSTLMNYRWLQDKHWYVASLVPEDELLAPLQYVTRAGGVLLVIVLALMVWPSWLFERRVIRPLHALSQGFRAFRAKRIAAGWRMAPMKSLREIDQLIGWFNAFLEGVEIQRRAEADLRIAATAFESQEGIIITDAKTHIVRINRAFSAITGYQPGEILGQPVRLLKSGRQDLSFYQAMWHAILNEDKWHGEVWNRRKDGAIYPAWLTITAVRDPQGQVTNYVSTLVDITERKQADEKIERLAYYDTLTQLPNRHQLLERLRALCAVSGPRERIGALMLIDLDNFKVINDTMGHNLGDELLQEVARRLRGHAHKADMVFRLGGDEFVVLLSDLGPDAGAAAERASAIAKNLLASLQAPYTLGGRAHRSTSSIGIALLDDPDSTPAELLKRAELAMYAAKEAGRETLRLFDPDMQKSADEYADLDRHLHRALALQQLELYYQVQVDAAGRPTGAEALLRWRHPERGLVSPGVFIPVAEQSDLIVQFGSWVLETACRRLVAWSADPVLSKLTLAVNVSARQFRQQAFVEHVLRILETTRAPAGRLKLELTESMLVGDVQETIGKMRALREHGILFSLDDFGTGYSSLSYLRQLPLDQLKIDHSFVRNVAHEASDAEIVRTILGLADTFGLATIAEGVETEEQRACLEWLGCTAYQGYLFGRPLPEADFLALARRMSAGGADLPSSPP